jgi:hypothetical protein
MFKWLTSRRGGQLITADLSSAKAPTPSNNDDHPSMVKEQLFFE